MAKMFEQLVRKSRLDVISFVAEAFPNGTPVAPHLKRSFRYELDGSTSLVTVHGGRNTLWGIELRERLTNAGYEIWVDTGDDTIFRRWLTSARSRTSELEFLKRLGWTGQRVAWPTRTATVRPAPRRARGWKRAVEDAYECDVPWSEYTVGLSRGLLLPGRKRLAMAVSMFGTCPRLGKPWVDIFVDIFDRSTPSRSLPAKVAADARLHLHASGYQPRTVYRGSRRDHDGLTVHVTKRVATPALAAKEWVKLVAEAKGLGRKPA